MEFDMIMSFFFLNIQLTELSISDKKTRVYIILHI